MNHYIYVETNGKQYSFLIRDLHNISLGGTNPYTGRKLSDKFYYDILKYPRRKKKHVMWKGYYIIRYEDLSKLPRLGDTVRTIHHKWYPDIRSAYKRIEKYPSRTTIAIAQGLPGDKESRVVAIVYNNAKIF